MRGADKTWNRRGIAAAAMGLACSAALAQTPGPLAQAPSQRLPEPPAPAAQAGFRLQQVTFTGAAAIPADELQALAAGYVGRDVSLSDLEALAREVTELYRSRGYFLAQALVPVQTVRDGRVEISVVEGRLGKVDIQVAPDAPISEGRIRAYLAPLQPGQPVSAQSYERAMLLLSDLPGIKVSSGLQEGSEPGTTDLVVEVTQARRVTFAFDADNHGTRESGRVRVGGTMRVASPLGLGDNLDARLMMSEGNSLNFGRLGYEVPLGTDGLRLGAGVSRVRYELGQPWSQLGAKGRATVADLSLNYPVIRQRGQNLFLRLGVDHKELRDDLSMFSYSARKNVVGVGLGWSWERRDELFGGGYWASTGTLYHGRLDIKDDLTRAMDQGPAGHRTDGGFTKLTWQVSRLQSVLPRHSLYVSLGGQLTNGNLDASEKLALGGARAVRAFPSSELLVDEGVLGVVEWRWSATEDLTPYVFYDVGKGRMFHSPTSLDTNNSRSMQGFGIGAVWSRPGDFMVNVSLAWRRNTAAPVTDGGDRKPRIFVQFQKVF
ncbi:ShlB/FhaC/HecB family hemolysin secretion/activation protein [Pigmentiphaga sp. H8]|uniref:ShlB/FhaC/HecB family hemolysin secretion/activation protein n=1 Tax=Pigmentiphaga sp. H8 TaxID=2488560 RepID=UPI000F595B1B|nr:ShlB/FhaC/HecB family hemolysin secretion/activation protein [Pigmentiphaga sp. H8]AZG07223.1 ShlB/FhaC/HecB family hemolysin secretion/activation protein [Pigmentiphaga sp. H8]